MELQTFGQLGYPGRLIAVEGLDGFKLQGFSSMSQISRDPENLVEQTCGRHHQYPDGFMLFLGTLFAPTEDRAVSYTHLTLPTKRIV